MVLKWCYTAHTIPIAISCNQTSNFGAMKTMILLIVVVVVVVVVVVEGSLEAKLPTIWKDGNGTARKKLGREESQK